MLDRPRGYLSQLNAYQPNNLAQQDGMENENQRVSTENAMIEAFKAEDVPQRVQRMALARMLGECRCYEGSGGFSVRDRWLTVMAMENLFNAILDERTKPHD